MAFDQFTGNELLETYAGVYKYNDVLQGNGSAPTMSNEAHSNLLTNFARHFEGTQIYDEPFSLETVKDQKIFFDKKKKGGWGTIIPKSQITSHGRFLYEATVENFASSMLVHEWYSHARKGCTKYLKSHRLAYKNVINFKLFWNGTTTTYKCFYMKELQRLTKEETGRNSVDYLYLNLYNRYVGNK